MAHKFTEKIKDDYGSVKRFCKIHGINYNTYNVTASGFSTSSHVIEALIQNGYIQSADELKRKSA